MGPSGPCCSTACHTSVRVIRRDRSGNYIRVATPSSDDRTVDMLFDTPARWRAEIITEFRLREAERCAAASPTPGFPQLLESVISALDDASDGPWLDVGGGLGGTASWIERTYHEHVIVADAARGSLRAARRLFPSLDLTAARAASLPIRDACVAVAIVSGVLSLLDDADALLAELRRVLCSGGRIAMTDLWSADAITFSDHPNTFWSLEDIAEVAQRWGFEVLHLAAADLSTGWWSSSAAQVNDEIIERHVGEPGFDVWREDLDHLDAIISSGRVIPAGLVLG